MWVLNREYAHNGLTGGATAATDIPSLTCAGAGTFDRGGCGFIFRVYLVDAERRDQAVNWWRERFVKTYSSEREHCGQSEICKTRTHSICN